MVKVKDQNKLHEKLCRGVVVRDIETLTGNNQNYGVLLIVLDPRLSLLYLLGDIIRPCKICRVTKYLSSDPFSQRPLTHTTSLQSVLEVLSTTTSA